MRSARRSTRPRRVTARRLQRRPRRDGPRPGTGGRRGPAARRPPRLRRRRAAPTSPSCASCSASPAAASRCRLRVALCSPRTAAPEHRVGGATAEPPARLSCALVDGRARGLAAAEQRRRGGGAQRPRDPSGARPPTPSPRPCLRRRCRPRAPPKRRQGLDRRRRRRRGRLVRAPRASRPDWAAPGAPRLLAAAGAWRVTRSPCRARPRPVRAARPARDGHGRRPRTPAPPGLGDDGRPTDALDVLELSADRTVARWLPFATTGDKPDAAENARMTAVELLDGRQYLVVLGDACCHVLDLVVATLEQVPVAAVWKRAFCHYEYQRPAARRLHQ